MPAMAETITLLPNLRRLNFSLLSKYPIEAERSPPAKAAKAIKIILYLLFRLTWQAVFITADMPGCLDCHFLIGLASVNLAGKGLKTADGGFQGWKLVF